MSGINWNLLQPVDVAGSVMRGFQHGRALRQQMDTDNALAAFARAPSDPASVNALMRPPRLIPIAWTSAPLFRRLPSGAPSCGCCRSEPRQAVRRLPPG